MFVQIGYDDLCVVLRWDSPDWSPDVADDMGKRALELFHQAFDHAYADDDEPADLE